MNEWLFTPARQLMADQISYTTKVQIDEVMGFIGLAYNNLREELLTEAKMISRQLHHQVPTHHVWQPMNDENLEYTS